MLVSYFFTNATQPQRMSTQHGWPRAGSFSTSAVTSKLQNWPPCTCTVWIVNAFLQIRRYCWDTSFFWTTGECCTVLGYERWVIMDEGRVNSAVWGELLSTWWGLSETQRFVLGYLFTPCTHFPGQLVWNPLGFISVVLLWVISLCVLLRRKMLVGGERISQVLLVLKRVPHSEGRVFLVINTCICYVVSCFCYFLFVLLQNTLAWWKMETAVSFCLFSLLNSGMSWGAQYNLQRPVSEINWHIQSNAGSISPK